MARRPRYTMSSGRWRIERERCHIDKPQPPREDPDACRVGDLIPGLVRQAGLEERLWERALEQEWPALVGEQVARRSRPGRVFRGTLHVFVSNSAWLNELVRYGQQQILDNVQERFGQERIRSIRLQLDPDLPR